MKTFKQIIYSMQKFPLHLYKFDQCKIVKCKYINVG